MINYNISYSADTKPSSQQEKTDSCKPLQANKNIKTTKKTKKKKGKIPKQQLNISCYKDLRTRNITTNTTPDNSLDAFISRLKRKDEALEKEGVIGLSSGLSFPRKSTEDSIIPELDQAYEKLAKVYPIIRSNIEIENQSISISTEIVEEIIINLISIKQDLIEIWNKYNPGIPYKYRTQQDSKHIVLEGKMLEMLDFVQVQLFNCYYKINDDKNQQLIIQQRIDQRTIKCFSLLALKYLSDISNHDNLDKLNFHYFLTNFATTEQSFRKINRSNINRHISSQQLAVFASVIRLFLSKTNVDLSGNIDEKQPYNNFIEVVGCFVNCFCKNDNYYKEINQLSLGVDFYYNNLQDPLFHGIHATLLTKNSITFLEEFSYLIDKLAYAHIKIKQDSSIQQKTIKNKLFKTNCSNDSDTSISNIQKQIKQLLIKYNIPTENINLWYDEFIKNNFLIIFYKIGNLALHLAEWIDVSTKVEKKQKIDTKKQYDRINRSLDILINDYKKLVDDDLEKWQEISPIILHIINNHMMGDAIRLGFGTPVIDKHTDFAILFAKTAQIFKPFAATALLAIVHKDSYDDLLSDLDILEFISKQTSKTKYAKSSQYLIAQIITYLIDKNNELDFSKKQLLFIKAEKLYLQIAASGTNRAYLFLAETLASLAKIKMYAEDFLEAAKLYDEASNYCKVLSEVDNLDSDLQSFALINMACFSTEADVLRKIDEDQKSLLQELEAPKATTKNKKKVRKEITTVAKDKEQQELAKEITPEALANWYQTYKATDSKPQATKTPKKQTTKKQPVTKLESRNKIDERQHFWQDIKKLMASTTSIELSYDYLVKISNNNYFKMLESEFKDGIIQNDSWVVLLVYQSMAYYHFLQLKNLQEIDNNIKNIKLFHLPNGKINTATKAKKATSEDALKEAEQIIRQAIKLVCTDIKDIETQDLRELLLSISLANYSEILICYKNQLASIVSTYGHLKSLDDILQGRRGKFRLSAQLYDKADEINPNRLIKKQERKAS